MLQSMTGFASEKGGMEPYAWGWELRGVNSKGLDMRLRVPDWIDGLEAALRAKIGKAVNRGNVTLSLRITREDTSGDIALNHAQLNAVLEALSGVEAEAMDRGISLAPSKATDVLALRGVLEHSSADEDTAPLAKHLIAQFDGVLNSFVQMRQSEGTALENVLIDQVAQIENLASQAGELAEARKDDMASALQRNLARVLDNADGADPQRVAQELAMIAIKTDVTEEIDRLNAHIEAARELIAKGGTIGRKLDFLMQEFNREANTLCSKAQSTELTQVGLNLKSVIDQMREQVQNVE